MAQPCILSFNRTATAATRSTQYLPQTVLLCLAIICSLSHFRLHQIPAKTPKIRVKPDQGKVYNELVKEKGLPLFRESGGRMVGWWNTLIGNVYEHVTIWEHGSMADFEKAVKWLGRSDQFAEFVKLRDPLLDGEDSRFLRLADGGEVPALP